jgi:uncharacterized protein YggT (Ycf19 family)
MEANVEARSGWLTVGRLARVLLWFVYAWLIVNLVLLLLAFTLRLFGANPEASFVDWVYRSVARTMAPFRGMFEPIALSDQSVLDTSLLFAAIIYSLAALFLRSAIDWITERVTPRQKPGPPRQMPGPPPAPRRGQGVV